MFFRKQMCVYALGYLPIVRCLYRILITLKEKLQYYQLRVLNLFTGSFEDLDRGAINLKAS